MEKLNGVQSYPHLQYWLKISRYLWEQISVRIFLSHKVSEAVILFITWARGIAMVLTGGGGTGADSDWGVDSVKSKPPTSHCTDSPLAKYLGPDQAPMIKTASRTLRKLSVSFISTNTSSILTFEITETNQNSPAHCWMDDILMCHDHTATNGISM